MFCCSGKVVEKWCLREYNDGMMATGRVEGNGCGHFHINILGRDMMQEALIPTRGCIYFASLRLSEQNNRGFFATKIRDCGDCESSDSCGQVSL